MPLLKKKRKKEGVIPLTSPTPLTQVPPTMDVTASTSYREALIVNKRTNLVLVVASDREKDLSNTNTGNSSVSLTESTSHSSLEPAESQSLNFLI